VRDVFRSVDSVDTSDPARRPTQSGDKRDLAEIAVAGPTEAKPSVYDNAAAALSKPSLHNPVLARPSGKLIVVRPLESIDVPTCRTDPQKASLRNPAHRQRCVPT
jgi:hypothetical protein